MASLDGTPDNNKAWRELPRALESKLITVDGNNNNRAVWWGLTIATQRYHLIPFSFCLFRNSFSEGTKLTPSSLLTRLFFTNSVSKCQSNVKYTLENGMRVSKILLDVTRFESRLTKEFGTIFPAKVVSIGQDIKLIMLWWFSVNLVPFVSQS